MIRMAYTYRLFILIHSYYAIYPNPTASLPSTSSQNTIWPLPDAIFPPLIQQQNTQSKRARQKVILHRDLRRRQHALKLGHIQPEEDHHEREGHRREQEPIPRLLLEQRRMLEDAESARAHREQVKPLHHDEIDEVDRGCDRELRIDEVGVEVRGQRAVLEPEDGEGDPLALEIPEGHGEGGDRLDDADEPIGLQHELPVHETVYLGLAGRPEQDVGLGSLVGEDNRRRAVGEATDDYHQERGEDLRDTKNNIGEHGPELGERARGEQVRNGLLEIVEDDATVLHRDDDGGEGVQQHHVRGFDGDVRAAAKCDPDVCCFEGGRVVDAVTGHPDEFVAALEFPHDAEFLLGGRAGEHDLVVAAELVPLVVVEGD